MSYKILNGNEFLEEEYKITSIRSEDKFVIMKWRNDQLDILRQAVPLTKEMQIEYFNRIEKDFVSDTPPQVLVSYLVNDQLIGYGGLVHINWMDRRAEVSFLLNTDMTSNVETFKEKYSVFLRLMKRLAFDELKLNKLTTEAFDLRPHLIETLENNGFVLEGILKKQNFIHGRYVDSLLHACFYNQ